MGSYTEFYGNIVFRPEVRKNLFDEDGFFDWNCLRRLRGIGTHPDVRHFLKLPRMDMIGSGGSSYFRDDAVDNDMWSPDLRLYKKSTNELNIHCSLKNYDGEIESFIRILPVIATDWVVYSLHEDFKFDKFPDAYLPYYGKDDVPLGGSLMNGVCIHPNSGRRVRVCHYRGKSRDNDDFASWFGCR